MTDDEHRSGVFVPWSAAIALLLVILVAFVVGGWRLSAIQQDYTNQIASTALRVTCESGNDFRALDKQRWDGIVALFGPPPHRTDLQQIIDAIEAQTKIADIQRDCRHPLVPPTTTRSTTTTVP